MFLVCIMRTPANRLTLRGLSRPDVFLLLLFAYGLIGSLYGILFRSPTSPALAVFVPMALGLLHLTTLGSVEENEALTYLRALALLMAIYVFLHASASLGWLEKFGGGGANPAANVAGAVFDHEKAFFICIALTAAWLRGRRRLFFVLLALSILIFVAYPAATFLVAGAVALMTLGATGRRPGRVKVWALTALALVVLGAIVFEVTSSTSATGKPPSISTTTYFKAVGKSNNTETRAQLWSLAWNKWMKSPVFGSAFSGNISLDVKLAGKRLPVPPHNDFLQMGMGGGFVGVVLLAGWIVSTNTLAGRRLRRLRADDHPVSVALLRVLLVGYNSFFAVAFFNPMLSRVGLSVVLMVMYSMMMTIGAPTALTNEPVEPLGHDHALHS